MPPAESRKRALSESDDGTRYDQLRVVEMPSNDSEMEHVPYEWVETTKRFFHADGSTYGDADVVLDDVVVDHVVVVDAVADECLTPRLRSSISS